ncbi:MAG: transposase [Cenarchaeum sp. SB0675_bin_21]|nr:transposase [Cenarchaeum sp. SB0675_bin_21]
MVDVLLDSVKYVIKPYYMMALVKNSRAITRTYTKNLGMQYVFEHVRKVAEVAYIIADNTGKNTYGVNALMYRTMRGPDPKVHSSITQTAIRDGVAAHKTYNTKTAQGMKVSEPVFRNPVVKLKNQNWRLNPIAGGYMTIANVGSSKHPHMIAIPISSDVVRRIGQNELGELWITPTTYTITYYNKVPEVDKPHPYGKSEIIELLTDVGYVGGTPKDVIGVDINEKNITVGDKDTMVRFDLSDTIQAIEDAKTDDANNTYTRTHDNAAYAARTGRRVVHKKEEERREKQQVVCGGHKLYNKLKRRYRKLKREGKHKRAAEIKKQMNKCILNIQHNHTKSKKNAKKRKVTKAVRHHEHGLNVMALCIAQWAAQSGCLVVLEDLTRISYNWQKGGKFGHNMRRRLHSAMMRKASNLIYEKSRFLGVEALHMRPHNTSKLCAVCRTPLTGTYHKKDYTHCRTVGVDRDVNAVENIRRTSAVSRYGRKVSASLGEVRRGVDVILDPTPLIQGCWSNWADRLSRIAGV